MERALRSLFDALASPVTTVVLASLLIGLLAFGLVVPQGGDELITGSYPAALAHLALSLEFQDLVSSWLARTLLVLLAVNVLGLITARLISSTAPLDPMLLADAATLAPIDAHIGDLMRVALPKASVRLDGPDRAVATRGGSFEGGVIVALGILVLLASLVFGGERVQGRLRVLEGTDEVAKARGRAERLERGQWVPWKPGFSIACAASSANSSSAFGPRKCFFEFLGERREATLELGRDIELPEYRLTLVGARRIADVSGGRLTLTDGVALAEGPVGAGELLDLTDGPASGSRVVASALIATLGRGDPVGLLPGSDSVKFRAVTAEVSPRVELEIAVRSGSHWPMVAAGIALVAIGLLLTTLWSGYRVSLERREGSLHLRAEGRGAFANSGSLLLAMTARLATRAGKSP